MDEHNKLPFNPALTELAQYLRDFSSNAEIVLWNQLKDSQLGCTFTWQHPIGDYVVTFFCEEKKLAIDIESDAHTHPDAYFSLVQKEVDLQQLDIRLVRLREADVLKDVTGVIEKIRELLSLG
jgi:very-short-patch-repair endonuclease